MTNELSDASALLDRAERVVALTGAGISTDSGIPDFRGPQGIWTKNPKAERMSNIQYYVSDPEVRRLAWQSRLESPAWTAEPNGGHRSLVELERAGRLRAIVTQNVDGLHQKAGSDPSRVIEVHGCIRDTACLSCGDRRPMAETLDRVRNGEEDPPCHACGGILKSATISFGQSLEPDVIAAAEEAALDCDLMLAIGTTLGVYPAAGLVPLAKRRGAAIVIVNADPTPYDDIAAAVLRGSISEVLPALIS